MAKRCLEIIRLSVIDVENITREWIQMRYRCRKGGDKSWRMYNDNCMNTKTSGSKKIQSYYSIPESEWTSQTTGGAHAIAIVGWDDDYDKSNFKAQNGRSGKTYSPKNNGAFLVKNSWGTTNVWDGYFWMSYEDWCRLDF